MRILGCVVAVVGALAAGTAFAAAPLWSVRPPAGWEDVSRVALAEPDLRLLQDDVVAGGSTVEIASYQSAEGGSLDLVFMRAPTHGSARAAARGFEAGARDKSVESGNEVSYRIREDGSALVVDHVAEVSGRSIRMRRLVGVTESHLVSVSANCAGPEAVCTSALHSLHLDRKGFRPLGIAAADDVHSSAYRAGYGIGRFLGAAVIAFLILWWLRTRRARSV
jgi:hypothetical protein